MNSPKTPGKGSYTAGMVARVVATTIRALAGEEEFPVGLRAAVDEPKEYRRAEPRGSLKLPRVLAATAERLVNNGKG